MEEEVFAEEVIDGTGVESLGNTDTGRLQPSAQILSNGIDQPVLGVVPEPVYENSANNTSGGESKVESVVVRPGVVLTVLTILVRTPSDREWA